MAIDDAEKRKCASGVQVTLMPGVTNNASKDVEWRQQVGWGYSGIVPSSEVPSTGSGKFYPRRRRRGYR